MSGVSETQRNVLALLAAALFRTPVSIPRDADWRAVLLEAKQQSVAPLVFSAAEPYLPAEEHLDWASYAQHCLANNMRLEWEHTEVHRLMTERGIPYVLLKGMASASYYPEPMLRVMGDVDFEVSPCDLERAGAALESVGFVPAKDHEHEFHIAYHRSAGKGPASVWEMHWSPSRLPDGAVGDMLREQLADLLESALECQSSGGVYRVPCAYHHGLILLLHTAGHLISTGIGLRHLCDWAVFADSFSDDAFTGLFEEKLRTVGLWRFAQLLTAVSAKYLGCRARPWAAVEDEALLESILEDIFAGGNFGRKDPERINAAKLMTDAGKGTVDDTGLLRQLCNSMNGKVRVSMPITKSYPVLLPVGWVYVGGRHIVRVLSGKRPMIHPGGMVRGAVERKKIYTQFRLFEAE